MDKWLLLAELCMTQTCLRPNLFLFCHRILLRWNISFIYMQFNWCAAHATQCFVTRHSWLCEASNISNRTQGSLVICLDQSHTVIFLPPFCSVLCLFPPPPCILQLRGSYTVYLQCICSLLCDICVSLFPFQLGSLHLVWCNETTPHCAHINKCVDSNIRWVLRD